jgi:biotin carboxylase
MRRRLARDSDLYTPFAVAHTTAEARTFLAELGGPLVIKPLRGAGSRGVFTGIRTERDLVHAWRHVPAGTAVLLEQELEGQEVDVEIVRQNGRLIFAAVADNPEISLPGRVETGSTYPSQLPDAEQGMMIRAAERVLTLLELGSGNFHIEMVLTADGPRIVEVNARMGGAFVFEAIRAAYGVNLVDLGLRALLSESITAVSAGARIVVEACFFIPTATGTLTRVAGLKELEQARGFLGIRLWKSVGQTVLAPAEDPADYLGFALFAGESAAAARQNALVALAGLRFSIRDDHGRTRLADASFMHAGSDYVLPTSK